MKIIFNMLKTRKVLFLRDLQGFIDEKKKAWNSQLFKCNKPTLNDIESQFLMQLNNNGIRYHALTLFKVRITVETPLKAYGL